MRKQTSADVLSFILMLQGNRAKWTWAKAHETMSHNCPPLCCKSLMSGIWLSDRMHLKRTCPTQPLVASMNTAVFLLKGQDGSSVAEIPWPSSITCHVKPQPSLTVFPSFYSGPAKAGHLTLKYAPKNLFGQLILKASVFSLQISHNIVITETIVHAGQTEQGQSMATLGCKVTAAGFG